MMSNSDRFDVVVVGGGPSGATAAHDLAKLGRRVLLLDRAGRIKPCGGAIPPRLIRDFEIPDHLLVAKVNSARMVSPSDKQVDMPIDGGFVGMVDRDIFDEWLRERAMQAGAERRTGLFKRFERDDAGITVVYYEERAADGTVTERTVRGGAVIGADGALSAVARQCLPGAERLPYVFAYHEIVRSPRPEANFDGARCDVYYRGSVSPDFYGWVFPHGDTVSVGTGSACKGFSLRGSVGEFAGRGGIAGRWKRSAAKARRFRFAPCRGGTTATSVLLAGDAAGVVAPASGEGIYYAMIGGRLAADAVDLFLQEWRCEGAAHGAKTLHANAWRRVLDSRDDAMVLVFKRPAPRALCQHLP